MSKVIFIDKDNTRYNFYCRTEDTRHGFKHVCELFIDGYLWNSAVCYYLNRTWERWAYQTVCLEAVNKELNRIYDNTKNCYKEGKGIKRLTDKHKKAIDDLFYTNMAVERLQAVKQELNNKLF